MRLKLISRGGLTNLVNAETGEVVEDRVVSAKFDHRFDGRPVLSLVIADPNVDIELSDAQQNPDVEVAPPRPKRQPL